MTEDKLNRLKEVLSIPTVSRNETLMIEYLKEVLTSKGYTDVSESDEDSHEGNYFKVDKIGNIYVTKGTAEYYPCFVSHTDTVHSIDHGLTVIETRDEENNLTILTGVNKDTLRPSGIGGDDKCGVFLCLEMLDTFENVKAAFFVSEEIGCVGSRHADPEFFSNVGYAIQYDSPEGNSMSFTLMSKQLFIKESDFGNKVSDLIIESGIDKWAYHPYTDIWQLLEKFNFSCLNLAAGYYNMHRDSEYVIVEDVQNSYELGVKLVESLGENFYDRPEPEPKSEPWWKRGYGYSSNYNPKQTETKQELLLEDEEEEDDEEIQSWLEELEDEYEREVRGETWVNVDELEVDEDRDFEDNWDYEDFNGGYSIQHYGSQSDFDFDW
jgi:hypothetical protein